MGLGSCTPLREMVYGTHVAVTGIESAPEGCLLSVRAARGPRCSARTAHLKRGAPPLKATVLGAEDSNQVPVRLDLLKPVAQARLALRSGRLPQTFLLSMKPCPDSESQAPDVTAAFTVRPSTNPSPGYLRGLPRETKASDEFGNDFLGHLVQALLRTVLRERPENPYDFLADHFRPEDTADLAEVLPRPSQMEVVVHRVEGAPPGAVLSLMAWKYKMQLPADSLGPRPWHTSDPAFYNLGLRSADGQPIMAHRDVDVLLEFDAGPGGLNPFRIDLLSSVATAEASLSPDSNASGTTMPAMEAAVGSSKVIMELQRSSRLSLPGSLQTTAASVWPRGVAPEDPSQFATAAKLATEYLENHQLLDFLRDLVADARTNRPADQFAFAARRLRAAAGRSMSPAPSLPQASDGHAPPAEPMQAWEEQGLQNYTASDSAQHSAKESTRAFHRADQVEPKASEREFDGQVDQSAVALGAADDAMTMRAIDKFSDLSGSADTARFEDT
mmetsp:Transcript_28506/g.51555  ORF Transcript_28506/g.51555 Transcript_28506/m.51555 type:complete len:501 (-) Transcript_28506:30-1532(-)